MKCPVCNHELTQEFYEKIINFRCPDCGGRMMTVAGLRSLCGDRNFVNMLWQSAQYGHSGTGPACPACKKAMRRVTLPLSGATIELDICCSCRYVWFDPSELEQIPLPRPETQGELPQKAREIMAIRQIEMDEARLNKELKIPNVSESAPEETWKYIPAMMGLPVELDAPACGRKPIVTWVVTLLCLAVFALTFSHLGRAIGDRGFIPAQWARHGGLTIITSMFLHVGLIHLLGNLYFLLIFGDNVEDEFGRLKYISLLVASELSALLLHALFDPRSNIPCVGASGFISGVIACYAICFPRVRLSFMILVRSFAMVVVTGRNWFAIPAWCVFVIWIIFQAIMAVAADSGTGGVAYMAHIGGVLPGILFAIHHRRSQKKAYRNWMKSLAEREEARGE